MFEYKPDLKSFFFFKWKYINKVLSLEHKIDKMKWVWRSSDQQVSTVFQVPSKLI